MMKTLLFIPLLLSLSCVTTQTLKNVSSGEVGCPQNEIQVTNSSSNSMTRTWTATCRGRTYQCSAVENNVSCAEDIGDSKVGNDPLSLAKISSLHLNCKEEIVIEDIGEDSYGQTTWQASCEGEAFRCLASNNEVACIPAEIEDDVEDAAKSTEAPVEEAAPIISGCSYDTQCKGDRVCEKGECVSPK